MPTTLRHLPAGPPFPQRPPHATREPGNHAPRVVWTAAAVMVLALAGCSSDSGQDVVPEATVSVVDMQRFPPPPDSRSLGAMDEPEAHLRVPMGPADASGGMPARPVEGRVFRRVSMVSTGASLDTLLAHYRGLIAEGGYALLFECTGVEGCGGPGFVSEAIEGYVTAPGNVSRAATVIALTQPTSGELQHFSLSRDHAGASEYISITVSRSEQGPLMVVTQQAFVATGN